MKKSIGGSLLALCMVLASQSFAFDKQAAVNELYDKSGLEQQLSQFGSKVADGYKNMKSLSDEEKYKLYQLVIDAYASKNLSPVIKKYFIDHLSEASINATLAWINSPLGSQITKLENDSSVTDPEKELAMKAYLESLSSSPPSPERVDLLNRLEEVTHEASFAYSVEIYMIDLMLDAMPKNLPPAQKETMRKTRFQYDLTRPQIEGQFKQNIFTSSLYIYKDISDQQISQYVDFLSTPEGKEYIQVSQDGLKESLKAPGRRIVDFIEPILELKMKQKLDTTTQ